MGNAQAPNLAVMEKFAAVVVSAAGTRVALASVGEISTHDSPPCSPEEDSGTPGQRDKGISTSLPLPWGSS